MGQNNQKDQKGPKMTAAVILVQNNQNNQKIWSSHISHTILKVRFFWDTLYMKWMFKSERHIVPPILLHIFDPLRHHQSGMFENEPAYTR